MSEIEQLKAQLDTVRKAFVELEYYGDEWVKCVAKHALAQIDAGQMRDTQTGIAIKPVTTWGGNA